MLNVLVPAGQAEALYEPCCLAVARVPDVTVLVERRMHERRNGGRHGDAGRRVADRRALGLKVPCPEQLPPALERHASVLIFVEVDAPSPLAAEDADSARLVLRLHAGDQNAFGRLYLRYYERLYRYLGVQLRDRHEAEDAVQDVFARAFRALPTFEVRDGHPVRRWLFRIARNVVIDRSRRTHPQTEDPAVLDAGHAHADTLNDDDLFENERLMHYVRMLPAAQREVVVLRYGMDFTFLDIAAMTGRTPDAVRQMHRRALTALRERLAPLRTPVS